MHQIYLAIRHDAKTLRKTQQSLPLRLFERANRGHQHMLDSLASGTPLCRSYAVGFEARRSLLRATLENLLRDLLGTASADITSSEWADVMQAEDPTTFLQEVAVDMLRQTLYFSRPEGLRLGLPRITLDGLRATVSMQIVKTTHARLHLTATREFSFDCGRLDTLKAARNFLAQGERQLQLLFRDANSWPEFSSARMTQLHENEVLRQFRELMKSHFTEEDRAVLRKLKPAF